MLQTTEAELKEKLRRLGVPEQIIDRVVKRGDVAKVEWLLKVYGPHPSKEAEG